MLRLYPFCKEEEESGYSGAGRSSCLPANMTELKGWWSKAYKGRNYPLFALVIGTVNDQDVASFIDKCRGELQVISGKDCCFIYFRDEQRVKSGFKWQFSEHSEIVIPLGQLLKVDIPSIVFFEKIESGKYMIFPLRHLSSSQILWYMRDLFKYFYGKPNKSPLGRIQSASNRLKLKRLSNGLLGKVDASTTAFFRAVGKSVGGL